MPRVEVVRTAWDDVLSLARSTSYRQRMTFLACQQVILQSDLRINDFLDEVFLQTISILAEDSIVDVRIKVARLLGAFRGTLLLRSYCESHELMWFLDGSDRLPHEASRTFYELAKKLSQDPSSDVKSFSEPLLATWPPDAPPRRKSPGELAKITANFSRPPPLPAH
jgi:serine/threonine-protein phosphatase 4 regulatory subunit 1